MTRGQRIGIAVAAGVLQFAMGQAEARPRHHHHHRGGLVASINAKLARYVHPTGRCGGSQEWLATYYGYESGRRTASGQRFHPLGISAAHRTLPFGTRLRVTNPGTGRSVHLTVNDRGPYTHAKIDLSLGAARSIGMRQSIYVCVEQG